MTKSFEKIEEKISCAVAHYWQTRKSQGERQRIKGAPDAGLRGAVTGGAQMNGFISLFTDILVDTGIEEQYVFSRRMLELPGFFRPTKEWDLIVVKNGQLIAAIEAKSQVGPSFGNNFNNRTEEAMGSALDLWTAFREGAFQSSVQPFLGYFFMLEECLASTHAVRVKEPHFKVFREFDGASYMKRYELFCRKLVLERHYTAASLITSDNLNGIKGLYKEPATDLSFSNFLKSLVAHAGTFV
jgi:hypothetical protein